MSVEPLSEREILLAQGKNPDEHVEEVVEETVAETEETQASENEGGEGETEVPGGKEAAPTAWYNDTTKGLAAEYGLNEDDLKAFANGDDFQKTVAFLERQRASLVKGLPEDKTQAETPEEIAELDVQAYKDAGFDEETIKVVEAHNALSKQLRRQAEAFGGFEKQVEELRQIETARQHQSFCNEFHAVCDTLEEGLVGRSVDKLGGFAPLSEAADANRRKLFDAYVQVYQEDIARAQAESNNGDLRLTPSRTLVEQAKAKALGNEIVAYERDRVQRDLQRQSKTRRPTTGASPRAVGGASKPSRPVDPVMSLVNDPELIKFWNKSQG